MGERSTLLLAGVLVGASFGVLRSRRLQDLDRRAGELLATPLGAAGDAVVSAGTDLGSVFAVAGATTVLAATGRRDAAVDVAAAGAAGWVVAQGVKPLVDRPRPYQAHGFARLVSEPAGSSWPSGHVAVAAAVAGALGPRLSARGRAVAAGAVTFVAASRVYVGVHYLSDVAAGTGFGLAAGAGVRALRRRFG
ncbi:MAG: phosphatase PAP2 family protein [Actinomycetes bacterium]